MKSLLFGKQGVSVCPSEVVFYYCTVFNC